MTKTETSIRRRIKAQEERLRRMEERLGFLMSQRVGLEEELAGLLAALDHVTGKPAQARAPGACPSCGEPLKAATSSGLISECSGCGTEWA